MVSLDDEDAPRKLDKAFADTGFGANVLRACASFSKPTPILAVCWPIACPSAE